MSQTLNNPNDKPESSGQTASLSSDELAEQAFARLAAQTESYLDPNSTGRLRKAYLFAHSLHAGQLRKSGEPYIVHPIAVAEILAGYRMDETSLTAALLHDVVEDTHVSVEEVEKQFGGNVAAIVDGLTKLAKVEFRSSQEKLAENFRKMIVAMSRDIRVIVVKLADRLHNMRTLKALPLDKRQRIAEETSEIYAQLAGRLGIYKIKAELEDLCLKELKPSVYSNLVARVAQKRDEREKVINAARDHLASELQEHNIKAKVEGRAKHFHSIYKKMSEKQMEFEDIYDLFALRVIVTNLNECYETLGIVHSMYKPVPGRFKDYIAMPKANLYQSLHTTVVAARGELLEVQIRTAEMNHIAENGIAAHWAYKEKRSAKDQARSGDEPISQTDLEKFNWLKQIVRHQKELQDPNEFLEAVKVDLFDDEVYVFSPKGDVFELRRNATCLDFAFGIHSDLGLRTTGAKVNGRMSPLRTPLHSGDVVEILSGNKIRATKDWLSYCTTSKARNKIRAWLRSEEREEAKRAGLEMLETALERHNLTYDRAIKTGMFSDLNRLLPVGSLDDYVLQIGYGKVDAAQSLTKIIAQLPAALVPEIQQQQQAQQQQQIESLLNANALEPLEQDSQPSRRFKNRAGRKAEDSVIVQGMQDLVVRLAKCCEPLPGQPITGFVSRGRGVTVHSASCPWALSNDPARQVECRWNQTGNAEHNVRLKITTHDKQGMLANIT
ncbi:bifunctional (p)ppGpp synthetase/guanosine-3',5'-bis(diphosphate) 3'-pyrophosphohydrolase, partial [bacterium]|nr:bifunctional (p)ppGpp synthetase/guanosine-3',5'-bis(diphosphate) 3'-pyrophosphohydrolase [bacterium]